MANEQEVDRDEALAEEWMKTLEKCLTNEARVKHLTAFLKKERSLITQSTAAVTLNPIAELLIKLEGEQMTPELGMRLYRKLSEYIGHVFEDYNQFMKELGDET